MRHVRGMCVGVCVCMYVCMYVCIYIYIYILLSLYDEPVNNSNGSNNN